MELVIQVPDKDAEHVRTFLAAINKPVKPHKGIAETVIQVINGGPPIGIRVRGIKITQRGMPEITFAKGDVVENTKSGNWGVVTKVEAGMVHVKCSRETKEETGRSSMKFRVDETSALV